MLPLVIAVAGALAPTARAANWSGETGLRLSETFSDNIARERESRKRSDWVTEVSPYIDYAGVGARANGRVEARLQNYLHTDDRTRNRTGLQLNALGSIEAYEDMFFIDAGLSNDRQQVSQFGASDASYGGTENSTEVTRFNVSPHLHWRLGNSTQGELRYRYEDVHSDQLFVNGRSNNVTLSLRNGSAFGRLGWALNGTHSDFSGESLTQKANSADSYSGSILYSVTPSLSTRLSGGQEFNDYDSGVRQHYWNWGAGLRWAPDARTVVDLQSTKHFFGRGFNYQVSHRMQRSAFSFSYSRAVSTNTTNVPFSASEYNLALAAVDSAITDPEQRRLAAINALAARGISSGSLRQLTYMSSNAVIENRLYAGWVIYGLRNQFNISFHRSKRDTLSVVGIASVTDDQALYHHIDERGWDVNWTHNLTSLTLAGLGYSVTDSLGDNASGLNVSQRTDTARLYLNTRLAPYTSGGLSYTHSRGSGSADYRENAVAVFVIHRF